MCKVVALMSSRIAERLFIHGTARGSSPTGCVMVLRSSFGCQCVLISSSTSPISRPFPIWPIRRLLFSHIKIPSYPRVPGVVSQFRFGPHTPDLMALHSNVQVSLEGSCPLPFFSPYPSPFSSGVNIFAHSALWPHMFSNAYVFHPLNLIPQVFSFVRGSAVPHFTFCVLDIYPRQYWWPCFIT